MRLNGIDSFIPSEKLSKYVIKLVGSAEFDKCYSDFTNPETDVDLPIQTIWLKGDIRTGIIDELG